MQRQIIWHLDGKRTRNNNAADVGANNVAFLGKGTYHDYLLTALWHGSDLTLRWPWATRQASGYRRTDNHPLRGMCVRVGAAAKRPFAQCLP